MRSMPELVNFHHIKAFTPTLIFLSFPIINLINYICESDNKMIHPPRDRVETDRNGCVVNDCLIKGEMV